MRFRGDCAACGGWYDNPTALPGDGNEGGSWNTYWGF
jgi:hypothetical protein